MPLWPGELGPLVQFCSLRSVGARSGASATGASPSQSLPITASRTACCRWGGGAGTGGGIVTRPSASSVKGRTVSERLGEVNLEGLIPSSPKASAEPGVALTVAEARSEAICISFTAFSALALKSCASAVARRHRRQSSVLGLLVVIGGDRG